LVHPLLDPHLQGLSATTDGRKNRNPYRLLHRAMALTHDVIVPERTCVAWIRDHGAGLNVALEDARSNPTRIVRTLLGSFA
jgi:hypothetical protein